MLKKNIISFLVVLLLLNSCASRKDLVYYQNVDSVQMATSSYESILQPDDILSIIVRGDNPEAVIPFNMPNVSYVGNERSGIEVQRLFTYLIDNTSNINFPLIGKIKLGGLTRSEAEQVLVTELSKYVTNPKIDLKILNFKVTVQGEVIRPGTYPINSERVTVLEALSLAGDLTIYGKRNNILLLREVNGTKKVVRMDLTKADFINSPYYYLHQNDVLYVEPNKTKINSAVVGPNTGVILSAVSLLVTVIALTIR
ncbi:sugar transporter [Flavobacterium aquatile]|uniref:Sugar transporter n=1 Tax=Flavobacterium aquatile LMG 4008 = ATCC 11947 TaxID=1453498 RepID=A0A095UZZ1_9FLAO|nr:sugar transporter [Flavobacterium aquatile LMG 4008 = ATCC 11947]OXA68935.1 sugar transporter [Flavobacterium aquatile] [Flavobacterium aquatile LMG 4008 = ATCC 11947]GEC77403.1 polysaccharide biosynthesis protein [Flavobacterium aquatile]